MKKKHGIWAKFNSWVYMLGNGRITNKYNSKLRKIHCREREKKQRKKNPTNIYTWCWRPWTVFLSVFLDVFYVDGFQDAFRRAPAAGHGGTKRGTKGSPDTTGKGSPGTTGPWRPRARDQRVAGEDPGDGKARDDGHPKSGEKRGPAHGHRRRGRDRGGDGRLQRLVLLELPVGKALGSFLLHDRGDSCVERAADGGRAHIRAAQGASHAGTAAVLVLTRVAGLAQDVAKVAVQGQRDDHDVEADGALVVG